MRSPRRLTLRLLWLASFAACASARPVLHVRPVNDGVFNPQWPELLRTRYQCENAVVGAALQAVAAGHTYASRFLVASDRGKFVCDLAGEIWPIRVRAFETDAGIIEVWEFQGPTPQQGRSAISSNVYQTWSVSFEGPTPHRLRVAQFSPL